MWMRFYLVLCFVLCLGLHVCKCTTGIPGALGSQEEALDSLEVIDAVTLCVGPGNQIWVFYKSSQCS